ncbi:MAG: hypothetical protein K9L73_04970 [Spirochaetia bacterium]|nr:hypothetical protein [Spirochaetia bacterium]
MVIRGIKAADSLNRQSIILGLFKATDMFISFYITRLVFSYIGESSLYGVWLTIISILNWFNIVDFGIANGLRNNLADLLAKNRIQDAKAMVSTAYALLFKAVLAAIILISAVQLLIDWNTALGVETSVLPGKTVSLLFCIMIPAFLLRLWLTTINAVAYARQDAELGMLVQLLSNVMILVMILTIPDIEGGGSLLALGIIYSGSYLLVGVSVNYLLFLRRYADIAPSIRCIRKAYYPALMGVSFKFFLIQAAGVIMFTTDNMIITQVLGASEVVSYQLTYKIFSLTTIVAGIILTPVWSAFTHAYAHNDVSFITKTLRRLISYMVPLFFAVVVLILISPGLIRLWIGAEIPIPLYLRLFTGLFVLVSTWNAIFAYFLNGVHKLTLQLITSTIGAAVNIPVSVVLAHSFGNAGVILGTSVSLLPFTIFGTIQALQVISDLKNTKMRNHSTAQEDSP